MACAALKRPYNFDILGQNAQQIATNSSKRRRCSPIAATVSSSRIASPFAEATPRVNLDNLTSDVHDEWRRIRRRRKLCPPSPPSHFSSDTSLQTSQVFNTWSSPLTAVSTNRDLLHVQCSGGFSPPRALSPGSLSPTRGKEPTFTIKQVVSLCERLWKEREEKLREEYNQVLTNRLAEQYDSFLKFTQDQIMRRFGDTECSYVS